MKIGKISKRDLKKDKAVQQRCMNPPYKAVTVSCILHKKIPLILSEIIYKGHLILNKKALYNLLFYLKILY